jgi:hypothetical protein
MGPTITRDCAENGEISKVVIGDIDEGKLFKELMASLREREVEVTENIRKTTGLQPRP